METEPDMDDEAWVERLRRAVATARPPERRAGSEVVDGGIVSPPDRQLRSPDLRDRDELVVALRSLEERLVVLEQQQAALADRVADAVIDRLDTRWGWVVEEPSGGDAFEI